MERDKHFLANFQARIYLDAIAEVSGKYGFEAVLQLAGLKTWIRKRPPLDENLKIDAADLSILNATLMRMYGSSGGRTLATHAGRASFIASAGRIAARLDIDNPAFQEQSPAARVEALLQAIADDENQLNAGHVSLRVAGDQFLYTVEPCPVCWGQEKREETMCYSTVGFIQQAIQWVGAGDDYIVEEASCAATKSAADAACVFAILRAESWDS